MAVVVVFESVGRCRPGQGNGRTERNGDLRGILEVGLTELGGHLEVRDRGMEDDSEIVVWTWKTEDRNKGSGLGR